VDIIKDCLTFLADNVFGQVPILIGLITLAGLLLQRKRFEDTLAGALRATIGVVILFIGIEVFVGGLTSFQTVLASAVGTTPPKADHTLADFLAKQGGTIALVITVAFLVHVLIVRLFPAARYLYLTGRLMFWISTVTVASLVTIVPNLLLAFCTPGPDVHVGTLTTLARALSSGLADRLRTASDGDALSAALKEALPDD
jgi:PTS system ascorbate-specific IIC component